MSRIFDFQFNNMTHLNNDECCINQRNIQNTNNGNYVMTNFFNTDCSLKQPLDLATSQPNIFIKGGNQVGIGGCNVDINSKILRGEELDQEDKHKILLQERPYLTVPYLGKGSVDPTTESLLKQGEFNSSRKTVNYLSEKDYTEYNYPLIDPIANTITNTNHIIESDADKNWTRGGIDSRSALRKN